MNQKSLLNMNVKEAKLMKGKYSLKNQGKYQN